MKVFIDRQKIERRARLSNLASIAGLVLLLGSVALPLFLPAWANIAYVLMIAGIGISMIGIYFANRWVRKPRPEASLPPALKSFDDKYRLYLYPCLPCDHILLTPAGLVALETTNLAGQFSLRQGQWKEALSIGRALRYIVEEPVRNPVQSKQQLEEELKELLVKEFGSEAVIPIKTVFVFMHPAAILDLKDSPVAVCKVEKLKKHVTLNGAKLAPGLYEKLASFLEQKTVS
jgi:hypothetical protein